MDSLSSQNGLYHLHRVTSLKLTSLRYDTSTMYALDENGKDLVLNGLSDSLEHVSTCQQIPN